MVGLASLRSSGLIEDVVAFVRDRDSLDGHIDFETVPLEPPSLSSTGRSFARKVLPEGPIRERIRHSITKRSSRKAHGAGVVDRSSIGQWMRAQAVTMTIYPAPDSLAFESQFPSIMAIHDLQHRLQPGFPEVHADGQSEFREYLYRNAARSCAAILVDSEVGKSDVLEHYGEDGATADRVEVLPFLPSPDLDVDISPASVAEVSERLSLPPRFLLYPAQFWPHKNHARLLEAFARGASPDVHLVLCGTASGKLRQRTYSEAMDVARRVGILERTHYLGYVSDEELSALYSLALALVFPTFFGPTNIPVIEAWNFGLPVLTSRIHGIPLHVDDAALLADPRSPEELAEGIEQLCNDEGLRQRLSDAGRRRLSLYTPRDYVEQLGNILARAAARVGGD